MKRDFEDFFQLSDDRRVTAKAAGGDFAAVRAFAAG